MPTLCDLPAGPLAAVLATLDPLPLQRPRPPIWVGGRKEASMRRAGRFGDVWVPYMYSPEQLA